ncbi:MAG: penicillin-binding protein 2 [bacterium]|nr:penicillin-binding protein 2 [bacterium]
MSRKSYRNGRRVKTSPKYSRLDALRIFFIFLGVIMVGRLFVIQVLHNNYYEALALDTHRLYKKLVPERGEILVQDKYSDSGQSTIATNNDLAEVHAEPIHITDPQATAEALSPLLNITVEDLLLKLDKPDDTDEILKRRVPEEVVEAIEELQLPGIKFVHEQWRYYPEGESTAHITGYFGYSDDDRVGQYGVEGFFNEELSGDPGFINAEKDAFGRFLTISDSLVDNAKDGTDLVLTIDKNIQFYACDKLKTAVDKYGAKGGTVAIMNPQTGAIIAMCNYPSYDPNHYNEVDAIEVFNNDAISREYEPGSVFKAFTIAAGLDMGVIQANSTYVDKGEVKIDKYTIKNSDSKAHGTQTMTAVLEKSLNTGTIHVATLLGKEAFYQYVVNFGFGEYTDIELAAEHNGNISELAKLKDIYSATASFGQGITVTPLQLLVGYGALANNGTLMKPYIVDRVLKPFDEVDVTEPQAIREVVTPNTARIVSAMLVNVIDSGHATKAEVPGYFMAGKTGTAQVVADDGTYSATRHNDTFVGYGPTSDPQFVMLIKFEEPTNVQWSADSAAPLWGEIAQYLVQYYQIPPDREITL